MYMDKTRFSIIIPVLHESDRINSLIDHIHCLARDNGHEIIVVDGSPGTVSYTHLTLPTTPYV